MVTGVASMVSRRGEGRKTPGTRAFPLQHMSPAQLRNHKNGDKERKTKEEREGKEMESGKKTEKTER